MELDRCRAGGLCCRRSLSLGGFSLASRPRSKRSALPQVSPKAVSRCGRVAAALAVDGVHQRAVAGEEVHVLERRALIETSWVANALVMPALTPQLARPRAPPKPAIDGEQRTAACTARPVCSELRNARPLGMAAFASLQRRQFQQHGLRVWPSPREFPANSRELPASSSVRAPRERPGDSQDRTIPRHPLIQLRRSPTLRPIAELGYHAEVGAGFGTGCSEGRIPV